MEVKTLKMKTLNLLISSKNKKSLNNFFKIFYKNFLITNYNFIVKKKLKKKIKKTTITLLKSPHVNKTAQEQFEIKYAYKQLEIYTPKLFKFLIFLKKLKIFIFPDINIKIKLIHNKKKINMINKNIFNFDKYYNTQLFSQQFNKIQIYETKKNKKKLINNINKNLISKSINSKKILNLFDLYGKY
jgi:ribosomal protein S10